MVANRSLLIGITLFVLRAVNSAANAQSTNSSEDFDRLNIAANELDEWMKSAAGIEALAAGYYRPQSRSNDAQRFMESKQQLELLQAANPHLQLSMKTPFAMMSPSEFSAFLSGSGVILPPNLPASENRSLESFRGGGDIHWTSSQCVAPIKNQGQCGSCWAFSAVSTIETAFCLKHGTMISFSEQQVSSCNNRGQSQGCNGGFPAEAVNWVAANGGLCTEQDYPYIAQDSYCQNSCRKINLGVQGSGQLQGENAVLQQLQYQTISVIVHADAAWQYYNGGILRPSPGQLNHAVVVVGYSSSGYWEVRNSWGTSWGIGGYILLPVGVNAFQYPTYPIF